MGNYFFPFFHLLSAWENIRMCPGAIFGGPFVSMHVSRELIGNLSWSHATLECSWWLFLWFCFFWKGIRDCSRASTVQQKLTLVVFGGVFLVVGSREGGVRPVVHGIFFRCCVH